MPITDVESLKALYGPVHPLAQIKAIDHLDANCRAFIANSPFMLLATSNGTDLDVSPKGDPAGSVIVEDDGRALLLADRPGNNRIDGLLNIIEHPQVATIFLIPGVRETLRINGRATIHDDAEMLERCAMNGRRPITVTRIEVDEAYLHCAKALLRSKIWDTSAWPSQRPIPTMSEMIGDHVGKEVPYESEPDMVERYKTMLY